MGKLGSVPTFVAARHGTIGNNGIMRISEYYYYYYCCCCYYYYHYYYAMETMLL